MRNRIVPTIHLWMGTNWEKRNAKAYGLTATRMLRFRETWPLPNGVRYEKGKTFFSESPIWGENLQLFFVCPLTVAGP